MPIARAGRLLDTICENSYLGGLPRLDEVMGGEELPKPTWPVGPGEIASRGWLSSASRPGSLNRTSQGKSQDRKIIPSSSGVQVCKMGSSIICGFRRRIVQRTT